MRILYYLKKHVFALALLLIGLHMTAFQIFGYHLNNIVGDLGDSRFIMAIVEFNYQWLIGNYSNYWDGFFMYPDKQVISYSDNLLGVLPIYASIRMFGIEVHTAFQLLIILAQILNFIFSYWCFNNIVGNKQAAASAAFIFAFSIILNGVHNHPQYTFRFGIPLFFYFFNRYLNELQIKYFFYAGLAMVYQFYLGIYLGYFLLVTVIVFYISYLVFHQHLLQRFRTVVRHTIVLMPLALLLLPMFYFYYQRNQSTGGYYTNYAYYMQTIPRLSSYLKAFDSSFIWGFLSDTNVSSQYAWFHKLFPGGLIIVSLILAIVLALKKQKMVMVLLLFITIMISFTTYYEGHTLYGFMMKIPGIKAARIVSRFVTVFIFFAAWLFAVQIDFIQKKFKIKSTILAIILPILLVLDNYCFATGFKSYKKVESQERVAQITALVMKHPNHQKPAFAYLPASKQNINFIQIDAMLAALKLKTHTVNGYSSSCHRYFGPFWKNGDSLSLIYWLKQVNYTSDSITIVK